MPLQEVWSGGQNGANIAGLRAAKAVGLKTGGWMPKGYRTEGGDHRAVVGTELGRRNMQAHTGGKGAPEFFA